MKDRNKFSEFMTIISEMHERTPSTVLVEAYWRALKPFTDDQCYQAFNSVIARSKFFPKPGDLIEIIEGSPKQIQQDKEDKALLIANNIISHLKTHGSRVFPKLDDLVAKHLMTKRWPYYEWAAAVIESELKWWTKEFCEAYRSYAALDVPMEIMAPEAVRKLVSSIG